MKTKKLTAYASLGVASLLLTGTMQSQAQVPITNVINTFDTSANGTGREWGPSSVAWDGTAGTPAGALLVSTVWDPASDTPLVAYACLPGENPWWNQPTVLNFSQFDSLDFDIKYDNTSDITIGEFNDVSTWPLTLTNVASGGASVFQSWAAAGQIAAGGSVGGLEIDLCGGPGGQMAPFIINTNLPAAASNGWVHIRIPINKAQAQIDGVSGIVFHKWCANTWTLQTPVTARFWIDNVELRGTTAPPPPPLVSVPAKATAGLNVFASTTGLYDRQSAVLRQTTGLSWVGQASAANPVTYSFTIAGYPKSPDCEAWMFLVPNPNYLDNAPDWNETNCAIVFIQGTTGGATMHFRYKLNEDHQQAMYSGGSETRTSATATNNYYYSATPGSLPGGAVTNVMSPGVYNITNESGNLASVNGNTILGTWTLKFTSDTNVTLIAPNGTTTNCVIPPYNVGYFAEQASPGFYVYLGMQANNANALNQAVVYSDFAISNTAAPYNENFQAEAVLDTTNIWNTSAASGPQGVLVLPVGSAYWLSWTLPDTGFGLQAAPTLNNPLAWTTPSAGPLIALAGYRAQVVAGNEVPAGGTAFFQLIKRQFTKLQVLLPGETNAPNTLTGKGGIPAAVNVYDPVNVTVNAVDATYHIVSSADTIDLTSTDTTATLPLDTAMANGTVTLPVYFGASGSFTVTATDTTNTNIPPVVSTSQPVN